jgi:hypothetical protein
MFSLAVAYAVIIVTGATPGLVALITVAIGTIVALFPRLFGLPVALSISPGPLGWLRGEPYRQDFLLHDLAVAGIAGCITLISVAVPKDVRNIHWICYHRGIDD